LQHGKFTSIFDFCNRVDSRRVNSRVIESLIKSGSFDSLGYKRAQYYAVLDKAMEQAKAVQRDLQSGQMSLFAVAPQPKKPVETVALAMPDLEEWEERQKLAFEKETVGFYITGHPLDNAIQEIHTITDCTIPELKEWSENQAVRIGGLIRSFKKHKSKKGDPMAFLTIEDIYESVEVVVFPEPYSRCEHLLCSTEPVIVLGKVQQDERGPKIIADTIDTLHEAREKYTESVRIKLETDKLSRQQMEKVKNTLYQFHGSCPVLLTLHFPGRGEVDIEVLKDMTVRPCRELSTKMEEILNYRAMTFYKKAINLTQKARKWENNDSRTN
jgi:DNA polymerase-3 subunit alpha